MTQVFDSNLELGLNDVIGGALLGIKEKYGDIMTMMLQEEEFDEAAGLQGRLEFVMEDSGQLDSQAWELSHELDGSKEGDDTYHNALEGLRLCLKVADIAYVLNDASTLPQVVGAISLWEDDILGYVGVPDGYPEEAKELIVKLMEKAHERIEQITSPIQMADKWNAWVDEQGGPGDDELAQLLAMLRGGGFDPEEVEGPEVQA